MNPIVSRLGFLMATALTLAGCGFEPIYARRGDSGSNELLAQIEVAPILDRPGQILRNHLIDMFDPRRDARNKQFVLHARLVESPQVLALRRDDVISRGGYSASVNYRIVDRAGRTVFASGASFSSDFEISDSERATSIAREAARDRLMQQLAEEMRQQIAMQTNALKPAAPAQPPVPAAR
jgi:LPS-assembly lipoprotein